MAEMHTDHQCIMAALLHDVLEDTGVSKAELSRYFGEEVAELVDGVSKLAQINAISREHAQADNLRKMLLAMTRDIRVILLKLADRLHNMRTLRYVTREKQCRIARETLEIYAPIANRLGMNSIRRELQSLGFQTLYPLRYRVLDAAVKRARGNRKEIVSTIQSAIAQRLAQEGLEGIVEGREKILYSLYAKMCDKHRSLSEVMDLYAFRIIVNSADICYRVLGAVHSLYKPVPGKFKDYIAIPKANGYQSLHTVLFGPFGVPIEVQIRTHDMDRIAEVGIAAHWLYKAGGERGSGSAQRRAREWLKGLLEIQQDAGDSLEFLENVKVDLFPDEVYVFTPKGKIMILARGATAVDFAYAVHTDVGNHCVAAKIDRRLAPLSTPLENGQNVQVITAPTVRPNPSWLNFVVTGKARANIRHYLKNLKREESIQLGERLLNKHLQSYSLVLEDIPSDRLQSLLREFELEDVNQLLEAIGLGNRPALLVARRLVPDDVEEKEEEKDSGGDFPRRPLKIKGTEGMVVTFAKCCRPIPGDSIRGFITAGRGVVIHTERCKNLAEFRGRPERWTDVEWADDMQAEFPVEVRVDVENRRGVLATVAAAVSDTDANIDNVSINDRDGIMCSILFTLEVRNRYQLARVMRRIRRLDMVLRIVRTKQ
jgi:GTP pyrophosphokinase/guanosine-3',5'-bis(diphosphate) 3'-pyrophosphohydrolase